MVRSPIQRPVSLLGDNNDEFDENTTINNAVTPPTTVWSPSVDGDDKSSESQRACPAESQNFNYVESRGPVCYTFRVSKYRVNLLGGILLLSLFGYLLLGYAPEFRIFHHSLRPSEQIETPIASSSSTRSSIPLPNHTYIIRSLNGNVLSSRNGQVVLAHPDSKDVTKWDCEYMKGWLGFRNMQYYGAYLGHNNHGNLQVSATSQRGWENFTLRPHPSGGYVLLMTHHDRLWYVGLQAGKLAKIGDGFEGGIVWEFIEV
jgi:hypothetical protein